MRITNPRKRWHHEAMVLQILDRTVQLIEQSHLSEALGSTTAHRNLTYTTVCRATPTTHGCQDSRRSDQHIIVRFGTACEWSGSQLLKLRCSTMPDRVRVEGYK